MRRSSLVSQLAWGCVLLGWTVLAAAQDAAPPQGESAPIQAASPATAPSDAAQDVRIDLPENLEVRHLIDIITERLGINILYDPIAIAGKTITVRSPTAVPEQSLLHVLESALQLNGLALVETGRPGWKKVVPINAIQSAAPATMPVSVGLVRPEEILPPTPVTQVFTLENIPASQAVETIRGFLTTPGGTVQPVQNTKTLIVTDFGPVVERIGRILELIDQRDPDVKVEVVPLTWSRAADVASLLTQVIQHEDQFATGQLPQVFIGAGASVNQVVIVGIGRRVRDVAEAARRLDAPAQTETRVYRFKAMSPVQAYQLITEVFAPAVPDEAMRVSYEGGAGALVVAAPVAMHEQLERIFADLDVPAPESPIQFYKLKNTIAEDVLQTLASLAEDEASPMSLGMGPNGIMGPDGRMMAMPGAEGRGDGSDMPQGDGAAQSANGATGSATVPPVRQADSRMPQTPAGGPLPVYGVSPVPEREATEPPAANQRTIRSVRTRQAVVAADQNTNSIIVIAPPGVQSMYARLIEELDRRRPQVLVECTILTLDTSDGFQLGVEVSQATDVNNGKLLTFSSFGLSEVDAETGQLSLNPALGANIALLGPDMANVVIQALVTNSRSRLISMPQVLVNDNEEGKLVSETEAQTIVVSEQVTGGTITSVGEPVTAGTTISVTPHISESDYLQLEYEVELSNFLTQRLPSLPPDTQRNTVSSEVTIPDGNTIVVGGLGLKEERETVSALPLLGQIPVLKYLFSSRSTGHKETTLFVFIRPVILRDDKFRDLKYYSGRQVEAGGMKGDLPISQPLPVR
jgi:type II secretory pathway component GspD/PulD (secretin)